MKPLVLILFQTPLQKLVPDYGIYTFEEMALLEAKVIIEMWVKHYNTIRPHSSLGYKPPVPETFSPDLMQLVI